MGQTGACMHTKELLYTHINLGKEQQGHTGHLDIYLVNWSYYKIYKSSW